MTEADYYGPYNLTYALIILNTTLDEYSSNGISGYFPEIASNYSSVSESFEIEKSTNTYNYDLSSYVSPENYYENDGTYNFIWTIMTLDNDFNLGMINSSNFSDLTFNSFTLNIEELTSSIDNIVEVKPIEEGKPAEA